MRLGFCEPTAAAQPQKENEIMMDTAALAVGRGAARGRARPIGTDGARKKARARLRALRLVGGRPGVQRLDHRRVPRLCGRASGRIVQQLPRGYAHDGRDQRYIMFKNSLNIEGKLARVIEESGLSMDPDAPNGVATNVNWSYLSANLSMDPSMLLALAAGALLIGFAGYLIIYNIFQISVMQDVRDYGLLQDHRRDRAADSRADSASGARALRGGHTAGPARRLSDGPRAAAGDLAHDHRAGAGGCPGASRDLSGQRDLCARDRAPERASPGRMAAKDFPGGGRALYRGRRAKSARGEARGTARASPRWRCITSAETAAGRR